jgi:hypothetical protein
LDNGLSMKTVAKRVLRRCRHLSSGTDDGAVVGLERTVIAAYSAGLRRSWGSLIGQEDTPNAAKTGRAAISSMRAGGKFAIKVCPTLVRVVREPTQTHVQRSVGDPQQVTHSAFVRVHCPLMSDLVAGSEERRELEGMGDVFRRD